MFTVFIVELKIWSARKQSIVAARRCSRQPLLAIELDSVGLAWAAPRSAADAVIVGSKITRHDIGAGNDHRVGGKPPTLRLRCG
ncbi:hypothetical protein [Massilia sp. YIM B02443]|uniref:hypothetical protein n=1 Tax=Massilia sp. YIM B02443 TaxID=3050127 RepID=UPI0025B7330E|nr:hypothetical protein [Massilia sp. YIM B02443]MDN4035693.1 hypothetical protein [Massilia sp. YIM B02443]